MPRKEKGIYEENGRFKVRYRQGGKHRSRTFYTKKDARDFRAKITLAKRAGSLAELDAGQILLSEFGAEWWERRIANGPDRKAAATRRLYAYLWNKHVLPHLGGYQLREISAGVIEDWRIALQRTTGDVTTAKAMTLLGQALKVAVIWGYLQSNPVQFVGKPSQARKHEVNVASPEQVEKMRAFLTHHLCFRDATIISTLAYSGVRPEELRALRWQNVTDSLEVEWSMRLDGLIKATKTPAGRRSVRLLAPLAKDLNEWRLRSRFSKDRDFIFTDLVGGPVSYSGWNNWRNRIWSRASREAGYETRPYDLRHTFASLLLHEGKSVVYVAKQMGHKPHSTMTTYAHVIDSLAEDTLSAEEAIIIARNVPSEFPSEEGVSVSGW